MIEACIILASLAYDIATLRDEGLPREVVSGYFYKTLPEGAERDVIIPMVPEIYSRPELAPETIRAVMQASCDQVLAGK